MAMVLATMFALVAAVLIASFAVYATLAGAKQKREKRK